jgi:hypothetical protein
VMKNRLPLVTRRKLRTQFYCVSFLLHFYWRFNQVRRQSSLLIRCRTRGLRAARRVDRRSTFRAEALQITILGSRSIDH